MRSLSAKWGHISAARQSIGMAPGAPWQKWKDVLFPSFIVSFFRSNLEFGRCPSFFTIISEILNTVYLNKNIRSLSSESSFTTYEAFKSMYKIPTNPWAAPRYGCPSYSHFMNLLDLFQLYWKIILFLLDVSVIINYSREVQRLTISFTTSTIAPCNI